MLKNISILVLAALVIALPFLFRSPITRADWRPGDPVVVIITPMNEAIRYEFGRAFSAWHQQKYGRPALVDWRAIGGSTEISRYLTSEMVNAVRAWWTGQGKPWPRGTGEAILDAKFEANVPAPEARAAWDQQHAAWLAYRATDDPTAFTCRIDLLFGAGEYDHTDAQRKGLTVPAWLPGGEPSGLFARSDGTLLIPERLSGETWRTPNMFGTVLSTFGICYNTDRLADLGITHPPLQWDDLADPAYFRQVGVADPTKSGSIAKAFEMIIQQKCRQAVGAAGFDETAIDRFEALFKKASLPPGEVPEGVPANYQAAVERGWEDGLHLVQLIGANARYFTDSASRVPIDVGAGDAAAGLVIDFYGRYQAQCSRPADGRDRMFYVTPIGGSSVSADPLGLIRGAQHRETALRFIEFTLSEEGQRLWTYAPGTPGGPEKYALRRLPIRRDFYPSDDPAMNAAAVANMKYATDDLADPDINPYTLATNFTYRSRWTGSHFGVQRDLIRAMCLDSADELRSAWEAILRHGGPAAQPEAMELLGRLPDAPEQLAWHNATAIAKKYDAMERMRTWTAFYRGNYRKVKELLE